MPDTSTYSKSSRGKLEYYLSVFKRGTCTYNRYPELFLSNPN